MVSPQTQGTSNARDISGPDALGARVMQAWKLGGEELARQRRDYWLNNSYYLGEQWIWWDRQRRIVQQLPQQYSPLGPGRARLTINRIAPNVGSVLGRMLGSELAFEALPTSIADDATEGARRSERVLAAYHRVQYWEQARFDEVLAAIMGGTSAIAVEWDGSAGKKLNVDQTTGRIVAIGEPSITSLNVTEFCLETNMRDYMEATHWTQGLALPPAFVKQKYGLAWSPKPDVGTLLSPLQAKLMSDSGRGGANMLSLVLSHYERPNPRTPKGKYAIVCNGQTIHEEDWPFPFDRLNLAVFRQRKLAAMWAGTTFLNDAVPIQFAYNHARSVIAEHMKVAGNARLIAPYGAFAEEDVTDDPASILFWQPDGSPNRPEYLSPPKLPPWMLDEAANLKSELDDVMFVHDTSRGIGFDRASGQALATLSEKDDGPLATMVFEQRRGWSEIGKMVLEIVGKKATETRKMTIPAAPGIPEVVEWNGKLLRGQYDVTVPMDAVAPRTKAAQMAYAKDLWDRQIITDPRQYARMSGLPPENFAELLNPDAASAQRENLRMSAGYVEIPEDFEDHAIHIAEHNRFRKSDSYKYANHDVRSLVDDHIKFHEQKAHQEIGAQTLRAAMDPALALAPQGNAPPGSQIPATAAEQQALAAQQMAGAGGAANSPSAGGGAPPGMDGLGAMLTAPPELPPAGAGGGAQTAGPAPVGP